MTSPNKPDTMMKSNTQASAAAAVSVPEYTPLRLDGWSHSWKVSTKTNPNPEHMSSSKSARLIADYYHKEECGAFPRKPYELSEPKPINRSYPRHHALVLAARCSSSKFVSSAFPFVTTGYERGCSQVNGSLSRFAYARVHDHEHVTPFTELETTYQKRHLTSLSGMTGLLVLRFTNHHQIISPKTKKKHAEITKQYLHSALAAEYLIGNRYYRNLMINRRRMDVRHPVGFHRAAQNCAVTDAAAWMNPDALRTTQDELRETYNANSDRLLAMIEMFKRGFVSIDQIREDPEFVRLFTIFWCSANQTTKMKTEFEHQSAPPIFNWDLPSFSPSFEERKNAKRISMIARIGETAVIAPMLYQYDVVHLFDNQNQSYANYVKTTKQTWTRLANDGSTASFLAFAAIEPQMVTEDHAPQLGGAPSLFHGMCLKSCANHVPTRHPVFGSLRMKHRCHIMRTADALNMSTQRVHPNQDAPLLGVFRDNKARFRTTYAPVFDLIEDTTRPDVVIDMAREFPETHQNTGNIISAADAAAEFKERVYAHGLSFCTQARRSIYHDDDYDDYDVYDEYDDYDDYDDNHDDDDYDEQYPYSDDDAHGDDDGDDDS